MPESVPVPVTDSPRVRRHIDCGDDVTVAACLPENASPEVLEALTALGRDVRQPAALMEEPTMRDALAALLRLRGYTHDDVTDPDDLYWYSPALGVRPLLACIEYEFRRG